MSWRGSGKARQRLELPYCPHWCLWKSVGKATDSVNAARASTARLVSWRSWPWESLNGFTSLAQCLEVSQEAEPEQWVLKGCLVGRPSVVRVGTEWLARNKMWIQPPQKILAWRVIHQSWEPNGAEHLSRSQCRADDGNKGQGAFSRCHEAAWAPTAWKTPRERRAEPKLQNWF